MYLNMKKPLIATLAAVGIAGAILATGAAQGARAVVIPAIKTDLPSAPGIQTAVLAGGCFRTMEAVFEHVKGVKTVTTGYAGGTKATATYDQVSAETTRHAEAIRIAYDPRVISYGTLLRVYFSIAHDPTQVDRQGPDSGPSYRSAIFPQSPAQAQVARAYIAQLGATRAFSGPIVTKLETGAFYPAEEYHQDFMARNPTYPYIVVNDRPKVEALQKLFPERYRTEVAAKAG